MQPLTAHVSDLYDLAERAEDVLREIVWDQWAELGLPVPHARRAPDTKSVVDPEALLLLTASMLKIDDGLKHAVDWWALLNFQRAGGGVRVTRDVYENRLADVRRIHEEFRRTMMNHRIPMQVLYGYHPRTMEALADSIEDIQAWYRKHA